MSSFVVAQLSKVTEKYSTEYPFHPSLDGLTTLLAVEAYYSTR